MTTAILVAANNQLHLYAKRGQNRIRRERTLRSPTELRDWILWLGPVHRFVSAATILDEQYLNVILEHADLITVPDTWLDHIASTATAKRARQAAKIARTQQIQPIQVHYAKEKNPKGSATSRPF